MTGGRAGGQGVPPRPPTAADVTIGARTRWAAVAVVVAAVLLVALALSLVGAGQRRAETAAALVEVSGRTGALVSTVAAVQPPPGRTGPTGPPPAVAAASAAVLRDLERVLDASGLPRADVDALRTAVTDFVGVAREEAALRAVGDAEAADALARNRVAPALDEVERLLDAVAARLERAARSDRDRAVVGGLGALLVVALAALLVWQRLTALARVADDTARFEAVVAGSADVIVVSDLDGEVGYASPASASVLGVPPQAWTGARVPDRVDPRDAALARALAARARAQAGTAHGGRLRVAHADGHLLHVDVLVHRVRRGVATTGDGLVWTFRDVSGAHVMEERLRRLAFYDPLTGLPNRVLLVDRLEQVLARGGALPGPVPGAVVVVDLDRFREVLDVHGRDEGGRVLTETVRRLRAVVPAEQTLARIGANAFAVLRDDVVGEQAALACAEELVAAVGPSVVVPGGGAGGPTEHAVSASAGVALLADAADAETILRDAHTALHAAKLAGGRSALLFEQGMHVRAATRLELLSGLSQASGAGELELAYQPVVDLATGRVGGVEALLRWRHPRLGRVLPDAFVSLAEEGGTIDDIGAWALHEACRQAAEWSARLGSRAPATVAVNLSARQLRSGRILAEVAEALAATGLPPGSLLLEITESVVADDVEDAGRRLAALKDLGVRLALDDFGTGYSSLASLRHFPIDVLKIDRSFLVVPDEAVLRGICALGASLGLRTIVEGVESPEQVRLMRSVGCDAAQGFLFAAPGPAAEVEVLFGVGLVDGGVNATPA